jgi:hypothetical protein
VLSPLLNQNQTVHLKNTMNSSNGDVCSWELRINRTEFIEKHFTANKNDIFSVFFNLTLLDASNITFFLMLGDSLKNTTNVTTSLTVGQTYQFPFMKN